ncbi:MAG: carbohydrate ABC transporter permease [Anaerolineales bacterium]|jgi:ABC-type glycerol-3-phosphate transport system permease component
MSTNFTEGRISKFDSSGKNNQLMRMRFKITRMAGYMILILLTIFSIFPLLWMVLMSLKDRDETYSGNFFPSHVTLSAYQFVFSTMNIGTYMKNSLVVTIATVLISVFLATLSGYAFARLEFSGKQLIFLILLTTLMVPGAVLIIPLFLLLRDMKLLESLFGLILVYVGGGLPFSMFLMRSFFQSLPAELGDAGRIDGASELGIFWYIMLPLARPGIATITIFQFMGTWNEFIFTNTFVHVDANRTLMPALFSLMGQYSTNWPALTAALTISIIPIVALYITMQNQFQSGLTAGALKY